MKARVSFFAKLRSLGIFAALLLVGVSLLLSSTYAEARRSLHYTISVGSSPSAGGTAGGAGTYVAGTTHTVSAGANNGYKFANWTANGAVVSTSASYTFMLQNNVSLVANFTAVVATQYVVTVGASPSAGGAVGGGGTFAAGSSQTVTATASSGYT